MPEHDTEVPKKISCPECGTEEINVNTEGACRCKNDHSFWDTQAPEWIAIRERQRERREADRHGPPEAALFDKQTSEKVELPPGFKILPTALAYTFHHKNTTDQQWVKLIQWLGPNDDVLFPEHPGMPLLITSRLRRKQWIVRADGGMTESAYLMSLPTRVGGDQPTGG